MDYIENMNIEKILALYKELEEYLRKYGDDSILQSYKIVKRIIVFLESDSTKDEKEKFLIQSYKSLFPGKGALSEFYIWDNDVKTRRKLNEPFDIIHHELWENMKKYV